MCGKPKPTAKKFPTLYSGLCCLEVTTAPPVGLHSSSPVTFRQFAPLPNYNVNSNFASTLSLLFRAHFLDKLRVTNRLL